ncbi:MAG: hybrid sensor histidine kinase/response regulator [Akkermansiaceae bacterium]|nr:hybrid sensor histidine kinase/response regulator [Verrucomicrobiales bacterium]
MSRFRRFLVLSFRAKVLVPVITVMVLLLGIMAWVINQRITAQFEREARRTLAMADDSFKQIQQHRTRGLLVRLQDLKNEPRFQAAFQTGDPLSVRNQLAALMEAVSDDVDIVLFSSPQELVASEKRDLLMSIASFEIASAPIVKKALQARGQSRDEALADTIFVDGHLYDVVSFPVFDPAGKLTGALTLGSEISRQVLEEFSRTTHSQIVLMTEAEVILSTLKGSDPNVALSALFTELARGGDRYGRPLKTRRQVYNGEHYFCAGGHFDFLSNESNLGYLLFYSYEDPLRELATTQRILVGMSAVAILSGSLIVCFLVGKVTQPLRELRDSAEAVGRGDFSRRVKVRYEDECGELARAFNQMTENIKTSREELEKTVETLKTTQAQLIQSEKLSGIGEFIAGVAHELNNPLTSVMGFSELLKNAVVDPKYHRYLDMLNKSAVRCQKIVQALLSFARRRSPERKLASVNELLEAAVEIIHYQLRTGNVKVIPLLNPSLPLVMVDPYQLQQVFVNIMNNARQAIEAHQPQGWIKVRTESDDEAIRIIFQDNGPGISPANLSKIFDPFFTTKGVGEGTGLGLSLCYGIIQEHGGSITPVSRAGEGATFIIELPLKNSSPDTNERRRDSLEAALANGQEGKGKRILVIDDEEPLLLLLRETLVPRGYEVDVAPDGESGLRQLNGKHYDLILCDWKMPGLNGQQVYERVQASHPEFCPRIVFITGDTVNEKARRFLEQQNKVCLAKPFTLSEFHAVIRKVLPAIEQSR